MKLKCAIFVGPSLDTEAYLNNCEDYEIFPPCKSGDIYSILAMNFNAILIVDGLFHGVPSVWHREIMAAIQNNLIVVGASSMGALRATELYKDGMIGVGQVFEWYKTGVIDADDEVALSHAPTKPYQALTEPLVDIRNQVEEFLREEVSEDGGKHFREKVIEIAKSLNYWDRSVKELDKLLKEELCDTYQAEKFIKKRNSVESIKKKDFRKAVHFLSNEFPRLYKVYNKKSRKAKSLYKKDEYALYAISLRKSKAADTIGSNQIVFGYEAFKANLFNFIGYIIDKEKKSNYIKYEIEDKREVEVGVEHNYIPFDWGLLKEELKVFESTTKTIINMAETLEKGLSPINIETIDQAYDELKNVQNDIDPFYGIINNIVSRDKLLKAQLLLIENTWKTEGICLEHLVSIYEKKEIKIDIRSLSISSQTYIITGYFGARIIGATEQQCCANNIKFRLYENYKLFKEDG